METTAPANPRKSILLGNANLLPLLLLAFVSCLIFSLLSKSLKSRKFKLAFPGPPLLQSIVIFQEIHKLNNVGPVWIRKYGHRIGLSLGPWMTTLLLTHPDDIKTVLASTTLLAKSDKYNLLHPWVDKSLFLAKGARWHKLRKLISPAFHFKTLELFRPIFNEQAAVFVDVVKEKLGRGEDELKLASMLCLYSLATIMENALGLKTDAQRNPRESHAGAIQRGGANIGTRFKTIWLHSDFLFSLSKLGRETKADMQDIHQIIEDIIADRKSAAAITSNNNIDSSETLDEFGMLTSKKRGSFLDLLLHAEREGEFKLAREDIRNEVVTFMVAGMDTTSAALFWTIMLLAKYPEEQAKLIEELDSVFGEDRTRPVTNADLYSLPHLDCCVKEGLRLYPSAALLGRGVEEDFQLDANTLIPKGIDIAISPYITHRLPEYFPEPSEFRPSRFSPENVSKRHPHAFIPFSAGPRNCIGQKYALVSEKILLAHIFRNFRVTPVDDVDSILPVFELVMKPGVDGRCRFQLR